MKEKTFSKKSFKKSQDIASLFFLLILAIAVASLICAFAVGEGLLPKDFNLDFNFGGGGSIFDNAEALDASDYYGTYYGFNDYTLYKFVVSEDGCTLSLDNGIKTSYSETTYDNYKLLSANVAQSIIANEDYEGKDAIIAKTNDERAVTFWLDGSSFYLNDNDTKISKKRIYLEEKVNDPRDYYTTYTYSSNTYVTFNQDGTAIFSSNGEVEEYMFRYVNRDWLKVFSEKIAFDKALLLYQEDSDTTQVFEYIDKYTLRYSSKFEFTGTGSAFFPYEEEEPDYSDPDYSDPDYSDPDYSDPDYSDPDYSDPDYSDPDYSDPDYSDPDSGSGDGTGDDGDDSGNSGDSSGSTDEPITELKAEHLDFSSTYACAYDYYGNPLYEVEIDEDGTIYITESGVSYMITENIAYLYYDGDYMAVGDATDVLNEYVPYLDYVDIVNRFEYDPYYEEFYCSYGENDIYIGLNNDGSVSSIRIIDQYDYYNRLSFAFSSNN